MNKEKLTFKNILDNEQLLCKNTYKYIIDNFSNEEIKNVFVSKINPDYMDGKKLFEHYDIKDKLGVNCLICECKRGDSKNYVALLVPTGYRYNMSSTVRKKTSSRMVSVAPLEFVLDETKMEYGSINPFGLPSSWKIFIDSKVFISEYIICGSGLQQSKLLVPSKYLLKLNAAEIIENLAKDI